jgi:hypothetical protein
MKKKTGNAFWDLPRAQSQVKYLVWKIKENLTICCAFRYTCYFIVIWVTSWQDLPSPYVHQIQLISSSLSESFCVLRWTILLEFCFF